MKIVLMGMPGAGKTEVSKKLAEILNLKYISSGDIARSMNTKPGVMADEQEMRQQITSALADCDKFVLDGLPRFVDQAKWLNSIVGHYQLFCLVIGSQTAISRMLNRGRKDDKYDIIIKRIIEYKNTTFPIIEATKNGEIDCQYLIVRSAEMSATEVAQFISDKLTNGW